MQIRTGTLSEFESRNTRDIREYVVTVPAGSAANDAAHQAPAQLPTPPGSSAVPDVETRFKAEVTDENHEYGYDPLSGRAWRRSKHRRGPHKLAPLPLRRNF